MIQKEGVNVVDLVWTPQSPLRHVLTEGRLGTSAAEPGVSIREIHITNLRQVMVRRGKWRQAVSIAKKVFGAAPPSVPAIVSAEDDQLIWSGPDQFLVLPVLSKANSKVLEFKNIFEGCASVSAQGDGRALIAISGAKSRDMLAKICSLDLDPAMFPIDCAATTMIDHTTVNIWRSANSSAGYAVFNVLLLASFAESLCRTILDASAEYGISVADILEPSLFVEL
jgi:methylglutamate dehydrogenase subunit D